MSTIAEPLLTLAGPPSKPVRADHLTLLALDLGSRTGFALRTSDGTVTSGTIEFRPGRFEGGGMAYLRFKRWLEELNATAGRFDAAYFEEVVSGVLLTRERRRDRPRA